MLLHAWPTLTPWIAFLVTFLVLDLLPIVATSLRRDAGQQVPTNRFGMCAELFLTR